jgi:hypothetical protein
VSCETPYEIEADPNRPPSLPSDPYPVVDASEVALDVELSWSGGEDPDGDPVTFDVYLGTGEPLPHLASVTDRRFDVGSAELGLAAADTIYWQVRARDDHGAESEGPLWSFRTASGPNRAPDAPVSPAPADGARGLETSLDRLSWSGGDDPDQDPVTYSIYFGTTEPPPLVAASTARLHEIPSPLEHDTTYFWRVDAADDHQHVTAGPLWRFTTAANRPPGAPVNLSPPDGATDIPTRVVLIWLEASDPENDPILYDVYLGRGEEPLALIATVTDTTCAVPDRLAYSAVHRWQIVARDGGTGGVAGPEWTFVTIESSPPSAPCGPPSPAGGATGVGRSAVLSWDCGIDPEGDPVTFNVRLDTVNPPARVVASSLTERSTEVTELASHSQYFWQVEASDGNGPPVPGPVWSFATANHPPAAVTDPEPRDGAAAIDIDHDLGWRESVDPDGDPVVYHVHLDVTSPPATQIGSTASPGFDPGALGHATTYFWQVNADDGFGGVTPGPVWSFTTEEPPNQPPSVPANPEPANGATGVQLDVVLTWTGGIDPDGDPVTFDVYFGPMDPPELAASRTEPSYDPPGDLTPSTVYYWRIVATDGRGGETSGGTWRFTTVP